MKTLDRRQENVVAALAERRSTLRDLVEVFVDPGEAYVCSPVPLSLRELGLLYMDTVPEAERTDFPRLLRRRSAEERWTEQRAIFQAARLAARRDRFLELESSVMAVVGVEFALNRTRSMLERWELLNGHVLDLLRRCEAGEVQFTAAVRDACSELDSLEVKIAEVLPAPNLEARVRTMWADSREDRESIVGRITERLAVATGADRASRVFEVIDGEGSGG